MDGRNEFREGLFPSGQCVPPAEGIAPEIDEQADHQLFNEIDHGQFDERALVLAKQACLSCCQQQYCEGQAEALATELWRRGVGLSLVGGTAVDVRLHQQTTHQERPAFSFDLTEIPAEPDAALAIIRQGYRAKQFNAAGPTPKGVLEASVQIQQHLQTEQPALHARLAELSEAELTRSFKFVLTALFQQKDFAAFSRGDERQSRSGNLRYDPSLIDAAADIPIVSKFLEDVLAIKAAQLSEPGDKAAHFEPEYYMKLIAAHKPSEMPLSDFDRLIGTNRNPIAAILQHKAQSATTKSQRTLRSKHAIDAELETSLQQKYADIAFVTPALIKSIGKTSKNPEHTLENVVARVTKLQEDYPEDHPHVQTSDLVLFARNNASQQKAAEAAALFAKNMHKLSERYANDPDVTASDLRRFSASYPNSAEEEARNYKYRLAQLRASSDERVTDSILRQCARRGIESPIEVGKVYDRRVIYDRFAFRAKKDAGAMPLKSELVERIVCLYPHAEIDRAAENAYTLTNEGLLVFAQAETYTLRGQTRADLDKIFAPKTQEYLTFTDALRALGPVGRLAFAHHYGLMPLVYGREANTLQLEHLALSGQSVDDYFAQKIAPLLEDYPRASAETSTLSIMELEQDLATFDTLLGQAPHRPLVSGSERLQIYGLRDATVVVGNKALYLHEPGYAWDWVHNTPDLADWLKDTVATTYPPHQQDQALNYITAAIDGGVLELLGEHPGEYRLVFTQAFYESSTSDLERAAVANAMGIDQLLYGSDLSSVLAYRLGKTRVSVQLERTQNPEIVEFSDTQLVHVREQLVFEALQAESRTPLEQLVVAAFGSTVSVDQLTDKDWQKIGRELISAYSLHLEHPNHRHEVADDDIKAQVMLAWTHASGGDLRQAARLFSIEPEDYDTYIQAGMEYIRAQFGMIPTSRLRLTTRLVKTPHDQNVHDHHSDMSGRSVPGIVGASTLYGSQLQEEDIATSMELPTELSIAVIAKDQKLAQKNIEQFIQKNERISQEDEIAACKAIEAGVLAEAKLAAGEVAPALIAEYEQLVRQGKDAEEMLLAAHQRLIASLARKLPYTAGLSFADYMQEGNLAFLKAIRKFDYTEEARLGTFVYYSVLNAMQRTYGSHGRTIRIPQKTSDDVRYYQAFCYEHEEKYGRPPSEQEILNHFDWDHRVLQKVYKVLRQPPLHLQQKIYVNTGSLAAQAELGDLLVDRFDTIPENRVMDDATYTVFSSFVQNSLRKAGLKKPAITLTLRYGLALDAVRDDKIIARKPIEEGRHYTLEETAQLMEKSVSAVRENQRRGHEFMQTPEMRRMLAQVLGYTDESE